MTINVYGYDIEIKAKADYKERYNKEDTMNFLNSLAILFNESSGYIEKTFGHRSAMYDKANETLYEFLESKDYYKA